MSTDKPGKHGCGAFLKRVYQTFKKIPYLDILQIVAIIIALVILSWAGFTFIRNSNFTTDFRKTINERIERVLDETLDARDNSNVPAEHTLSLSENQATQIYIDANNDTKSINQLTDNSQTNSPVGSSQPLAISQTKDKSSAAAEIVELISYSSELTDLENQFSSSNLLAFIYTFLSGSVIVIVTERLSKINKAEESIKQSKDSLSELESQINAKGAQIDEKTQQAKQLIEQTVFLYCLPFTVISFELSKIRGELQKNEAAGNSKEKEDTILSNGIATLNDMILYRLGSTYLSFSKEIASNRQICQAIESEIHALWNDIERTFQTIINEDNNIYVKKASENWKEKLTSIRNNIHPYSQQKS